MSIMGNYRYSALGRDGRSAAGVVSATTRAQAIAALAEQGRFVTDLAEEGGRAAAPATEAAVVARVSLPTPGARAEAGLGTGLGASVGIAWPWRRRVSLRAKAALFAQLATALEAGLALLPALRVVEEQAGNLPLRDLVADLAARVQGGDALSEAFRRHPGTFSALEVSMIRVGETAGVLDQVMASLASFAERDLDFREKIRGAATYPLFVLGLAGVSVLVILVFILPRILSVVGGTPGLLPWPTRVLLGVSTVLRYWGWLVALLVGVGVWRLRVWRATPAGRLALDRLKLRVPVLGPALRRVAVARFARTLGTLTGAGIEIIESMRVLRDTLGNEALARKIDDITAGITQGKSIAEPLRQTGEFPPLLIQVIALGERTGRLDALLLKAADAYEKETAAAVQRAMAILPAVLIVCLALLVAFILAAVLLPVVGLELSPPGG